MLIKRPVPDSDVCAAEFDLGTINVRPEVIASVSRNDLRKALGCHAAFSWDSLNWKHHDGFERTSDGALNSVHKFYRGISIAVRTTPGEHATTDVTLVSSVDQ